MFLYSQENEHVHETNFHVIPYQKSEIEILSSTHVLYIRNCSLADGEGAGGYRKLPEGEEQATKII